MPPARLIFAALLAAALAAPAQAQVSQQVTIPGPPEGVSDAEAAIWPFPPPDPQSWWDEDWPRPPETADPLGDRRLRRGEQLSAIPGAPDASTYRLWGLMPLQWQILRGDEMILEVWTRPARTVRQSVVRIVVRRDGDAFVQARAGYACCQAGIARRMGFDRELPEGAAQLFRPLQNHPAWETPRDVLVDEGPGLAEAVCVDGTSYDLVLLTTDRARVLRRACDNAEIGQVADVLEPVIAAALGYDPRFDVLYSRGADFSAARSAHQGLLEYGGRLVPDLRAQETNRPSSNPRP